MSRAVTPLPSASCVPVSLAGGEANAQQPITISMTPTLSGNAPTRPDGSSLPSCGPNGEPPESGGDCPPGMSCGGVICERSCALTEDCSYGQECILGCCKEPVEIEEPDEPTDWSSMVDYERPGIGLWLHLSVGVGMGILPESTVKEPRWFTDVLGNTWYGPDHATPGHQADDPGADRQTAPVDLGMALSGFAMRLGIGYDVLPFLSLELNYRFSAPFDATDSMFPWLVEARIAYWFLTGPDHAVSALIGGGAGIMTHMVSRVVFNQNLGDPPSNVYEPFYRLSGYGAVAVGAQYRYFLTDMWAIGAELAMNAMVGSSINSFAWNFDALFDATVAF